MRRVRKLALAVYLVAGVVVAGWCAGSQFGPYTERFRALAATPAGSVLLAVCLVVVALQILAVLIALFSDRPEPAFLRLEGNPHIEVRSDALASLARTAASGPDVLIERVDARVRGRDRQEVRVRVEAVSLAMQDLDGLAHRMQVQVQEACDRMLGVPGAVVQVRFLPSRTVTVIKEVVGE